MLQLQPVSVVFLSSSTVADVPHASNNNDDNNINTNDDGNNDDHDDGSGGGGGGGDGVMTMMMIDGRVISSRSSSWNTNSYCKQRISVVMKTNMLS